MIKFGGLNYSIKVKIDLPFIQKRSQKFIKGG